MRIIKQGKNPVTERRITCNKCDCVFEYERNDMHDSQRDPKPWVYCPWCNNVIEVEYWKYNIPLPKRGDLVRIIRISEKAVLHKTKLKVGDVVEVVSSWEHSPVRYVRIKYPDGKRKQSPIRSYLYEWEILERREKY